MIYLYSNEIIKNVGSILCNVSFNFFADCLCVVFVFKRRIVSDFNHLQPLSDITVHFRTVTSNFGQKRLLSEIFLYRLSNFIENRSIFQKSFINLGNAGKMSSLGNEILISFRLYLSVYTSSNGGVGWD